MATAFRITLKPVQRNDMMLVWMIDDQGCSLCSAPRFHGQDVPPVLDPFSTQRTVPTFCSTKVKYAFWDTSSTDNRLRSMAYPDTDAFLVCYDLTSPESYGNAISKWLPEVKGGRKSGRQMIPVLFIGTKRDLLPPVEQDGWDQDGWDRRHNVEDMLKAQPYRQGTVIRSFYELL